VLLPSLHLVTLHSVTRDITLARGLPLRTCKLNDVPAADHTGAEVFQRCCWMCTPSSPRRLKSPSKRAAEVFELPSCALPIWLTTNLPLQMNTRRWHDARCGTGSSAGVRSTGAVSCLHLTVRLYSPSLCRPARARWVSGGRVRQSKEDGGGTRTRIKATYTSATSFNLQTRSVHCGSVQRRCERSLDPSGRPKSWRLE
jgi:hypothetical protein